MDKRLKNNWVDYITSISKAGTGTIPLAGSMVSELISSIIPGQRIDRIAQYCSELEEKMAQIPVNKLHALFKNKFVINLLEEGFIAAGKAITDERRAYIANFVINGIEKDDVDFIRTTHLLNILNELNDEEIILLYLFTLKDNSNPYHEFKIKYNNIFRYDYPKTTDGNEETLHFSIIKAYTDHLSRLNLIILDMGNSTGAVAERNARKRTTHLGNVLLQMIGIDKILM